MITVDPTTGAAHGWLFADNTITYGGWRLRMNYTNKLEGSPLGSPVSALGEVFIVSDGGCPAGFTTSRGFARLKMIANIWRQLALFGLITYFVL